MSRIFIINVGANASHGRLRSPIFENNTFEFVPIPETGRRVSCPDCLGLPRYSDLLTFNNLDYYDFIPKSYLELRVHNDPEFDSYTYGDYPTISPRAMNLRKAVKGDFIFFLARLVRYNYGSFGKPGFFLIGCFEVESILKDVVEKPDDKALHFFGKNAHVQRALYSKRFWDGFWVFKGSKKSRRFKHAISFDKKFCDSVLLDSRGNTLVWPSHRSELQIIGSYTRACRVILQKDLVEAFWKRIDCLDQKTLYKIVY